MNQFTNNGEVIHMFQKAFLNLDKEKQDELLNKAMHLYIDHKYENVTIKLILEALSLHPGTFYRYFKDKDNLYYAILCNLAQKVKDSSKNQGQEYVFDLVARDNTAEPLNELEVKFVKTVMTLPVDVLAHLYLDLFKDESVAVFKDLLRRLRYDGKLRPDIDDDLISFIYATVQFNLILFYRDAGIEDEDLQIKARKYFDKFFLHGLIKDSAYEEE
jgi:AcrR family transcriptional regulator